jgi:hypothetical protein
MLRLLLRWPLPYGKPARKARNNTRAFRPHTAVGVHSGTQLTDKASKGTFKLAS